MTGRIRQAQPAATNLTAETQSARSGTAESQANYGLSRLMATARREFCGIDVMIGRLLSGSFSLCVLCVSAVQRPHPRPVVC